ncbi:MAG: cell division protein FtsQ/DivIB [Pseudomonadota bacterium]
MMKLLASFWTGRAKNRAKVEKDSRFSLRMPQVNWARLTPFVLGAGVIGSLIGSAGFALDRPVRRIEMIGAFQRVSSIDVEHIVRERLRGGFVSANLDVVQHSIEGLSWVDHARVQRRWPDALVVQVTEQSAIARWGDTGLINARGELFIKDARHVPPELPRLEGPDGAVHDVSEVFFEIQPRMLEAGLPISALRQDPRGAWELDLVNGVTIRLGRRQLQERLERFLKSAAPLVASRPNDIAFLDMRYSNGFSVGWRTPGAPQARPASGEEAPMNQKRDQDV